jgi:hypothetical protein
MAKLTAKQIAEQEAKIIFSQVISYDRSKGFCGDLYVGMKPVTRAVMVIKSDQESSTMVQQGKPYVAFITANEAFQDDAAPHSHFFSNPEDAVEFVRNELKHHKLVGVAKGTHAF